MPSELDSSGMSGRGGLTLAFFIFLAALLFFIPELLSLKRSVGTGDKEAVAPVVEETPDAENLTAGERLTRVLTALDQDDGAMIPSWEDTDIEALPEDRKVVAKMLRDEEISWRLLKKKPVRGLVSAAQKDIAALYKQLDAKKFPQSRFALVNYGNGLAALLRGDAKQVPPEEYLGYLTELDIAVSNAMIAENVQEPDFRKWRSVSLAPLVVQGTAEMKRKHAPPFIADVILTEVSVRKHPERPNQAPFYSVRGRGYVVGSAAAEIEVISEGRRVAIVKLAPQYDRKRFTFSMQQVRGDPPVTLRVRDEFHRSRVKYYRFIRPAQSYPLGADGIYQVPGTLRVAKDEMIPRNTDRLFAASGGSTVIASAAGVGPQGAGAGQLSPGGFSRFREAPGSYVPF